MAEKEVTTLKEQIATNSNATLDVKECSNMDRSTYESEMVAKDKEVSRERVWVRDNIQRGERAEK